MRLGTAAVAAVAMGGGLVVAVPPYGRAASFVARVADAGGWPERAAGWSAEPFATLEVTIATRSGHLPARLFLPSYVRRAAVLVPGIHPDGIDEPRLVGLSRDLAASGMAVLTPEIPDLRRLRITPAAVDRIEDAAIWLASRPQYAPGGLVGLMGISFSGGLAVVAAGRSPLGEKVAFVFAVGGHGDLERVLRFLCTGVDADGSSRRPHDYGLAVVLLSLAPRLVPDDQVAGLVQGTETFLLASALDHVKDPRARDRFEQARRIARELPEPAASLLHLVNTRDVEKLGALLLPHVSVLAVEPSVSPERVPPPSAPVFLLHGTDDTVVPSAESVWLGRHLDERGVETHVLLSPLITHAEVEHPPDMLDAWRLVGFWKDLLQQ